MGTVKWERKGKVALVTVDRPEVYNALNREVFDRLQEIMNELIAEEEIHVLLLTGAGDKAFIAGADITAMASMSEEALASYSRQGQQVASTIEQAPFITIAAVNGYALGGGLEMALACDLIYAADDAQLGMPEVQLALIPGFGGVQRLVKAIGERRTKELLFTGKKISAGEALQLGLINGVYEKSKLLTFCFEFANSLALAPYKALRNAKKAVQSAGSHTVDKEKEIAGFVDCFNSSDCKFLLEKFLNKKNQNSG